METASHPPKVEEPAGSGGTAEQTSLLRAWRSGDAAALPRLLAAVYAELRQLAARAWVGERAGHTWQPTALVHEAFVRLAEGRIPPWQDRAHFFAVAAQVMRRLLVDHARARRTAKRGSGASPLPLSPTIEMADPDGRDPVEILALDTALGHLAAFDPRKARAVELRYFGGLTLAEIAEALAVSTATVIVDLRLAKAWLARELKRL
jgi:RNA polymerase sigma-70 factor (ECF subfamily)